VVAATFGQPPRDGQRWVEHIDAVILLLTHRGIESARLTFRGPKCGAVKDVVNEQARAVTEVWADENNDHSAAYEAIKTPWLRVMGTIVLEAKKARKAPFRDYVQANSHTRATSAGDMQAINSAIVTDEFRNALQSVMDEHVKRIAEVKMHCKD